VTEVRTVGSATIGASFVPRLRDEVAFIPVEDEALLYLEDVGLLHQLDRIGAIVCRCFDGETAIASMAGELAAAFETDRDVVEADVIGFARQLGDLGLLDGVAPAGEPERDGEHEQDAPDAG
jgi:hypothetical protein